MFPKSLLCQSPSDFCRLTFSGNRPKLFMRFDRIFRLIGTWVLEPCTWCMYSSNPTRTKSLYLCTICGLSYITNSIAPTTFCVYHWTCIVYPFRPTDAHSIFLLPLESFFKIQQSSHSVLEMALPIQMILSMSHVLLNANHDPDWSDLSCHSNHVLTIFR